MNAKACRPERMIVQVRGGFARAEALLLLGAVVMLLSIAVPVHSTYRLRHQLGEVEKDFIAIVGACDRYFNIYQSWPSALMGRPRDVRYGVGEHPNREVMNVLRSIDGPGNEAYAANPNRMVFLERPGRGVGPEVLTGEGDYLDPWQRPYQLVIDTDADENCYVADSLYGMQSGQDLLVWSLGPDGRSDTSDDILAWRRSKRGG